MRRKYIRLLAEMLAEGKTICHSGQIVRAEVISNDEYACAQCVMHDNLDTTFCNICEECDWISNKTHKLVKSSLGALFTQGTNQ